MQQTPSTTSNGWTVCDEYFARRAVEFIVSNQPKPGASPLPTAKTIFQQRAAEATGPAHSVLPRHRQQQVRRV